MEKMSSMGSVGMFKGNRWIQGWMEDNVCDKMLSKM